MKYIVILGDGMADEPIDALGGKSPLACAETPVWTNWRQKAKWEWCRMSPPGWLPGSDVANLSVLGYDPTVCYSGRSPLEALSVGVAMEPDGHRSALQHRNADRGRTLRQKDHS